MLVQHSVCVDRSIESVSAALAAVPRQWFPRFGGPSDAGVAGPGLGKKVSMEIGEPLTFGDWAEVAVTWRATFIQRLLPVMSGKAEFEPVNASITRLSVCGRYEPPLGELGKQLDDGLMHRVAVATVRGLAESIAKRLEALEPETV